MISFDFKSFLMHCINHTRQSNQLISEEIKLEIYFDNILINIYAIIKLLT